MKVKAQQLAAQVLIDRHTAHDRDHCWAAPERHDHYLRPVVHAIAAGRIVKGVE